jgi:hypothetical protein
MDDPGQTASLRKEEAVTSDEDLLATTLVVDDAHFAHDDRAELVFGMLFFEHTSGGADPDATGATSLGVVLMDALDRFAFNCTLSRLGAVVGSLDIFFDHADDAGTHDRFPSIDWAIEATVALDAQGSVAALAGRPGRSDG